MASFFDSAKNMLHGGYKQMMEKVTTVQTESEFTEKGTLTPDEFVKAGDQLISQCPTWTWEEGDKKLKWNFLDEKQFLQTRKVHCLARVASLMQKQDEKIVENGEWLSMDDQGTHQTADQIKDIDLDDIGDIDDIDANTTDNNSNNNNKNSNNNNNNNSNNKNSNNNNNNDTNGNIQNGVIKIVEHSAFQNNNDQNSNNNTNNTNNKTNNNDNDDGNMSDDSFEEIPDIDTFNDADNVVSKPKTEQNSNNTNNQNNTSNDNSNTNATNNSSNNSNNNSNNNNTTNTNDNNNNIDEKDDSGLMFKVKQDDNDTIVKARSYDMSITYDKYYKVPRVWLRGYDENGNPLTSSQIFEDISGDHAHKTVTVEAHPHLSNVICAGIHPCRHSEVMKTFMDRMANSGKNLSVDQYLFLFLKFMSAVIPTIEYDFTQSVDG